MGGVTKWRNACTLDECDVNHVRKDDGTIWGNGVRFLPAQQFVDPIYFTRLGVRFIWQDDVCTLLVFFTHAHCAFGLRLLPPLQ